MVNFPHSAIRNRRTKSIFKNAKKIYENALVTLQYSKSDDVEALRNSLRHYAVQGAALKARERFLSISLSLPFVLIAYSFIVAAYLGLGIGTSLQAGVGAAVASAGVAGILAFPIARAFKQPGKQSLYIFLLALTIFSVTMVVSHAPHKPWIEIPNASHHTPNSGIIDDFILLAVAAAALAAVQYLSALSFTLVITPGRKRNSNVVIVDILISILKMLARKTSRSDDISTRAWICSHLQYAANYLEEGVPRALALPDPSMRQTLQEKLTSGAAYLREIQLWIALAKDEAQNDARDAIAHCIELIAQGKYDSIPAGTLARLENSKTSKLVGFGRALVVAVVPFGCLIGIRYAGLKLSSDFTGWAVVISLAWAAITLISAIDPLYKTRLKDMQDLIATIRGKE
jgi:hypothetical protein